MSNEFKDEVARNFVVSQIRCKNVGKNTELASWRTLKSVPDRETQERLSFYYQQRAAIC
jgi:hypothetical protein